MTRPLITVDAEATAQESMEVMSRKDIGALVVTENGEPSGIITERDIIRKCCRQASCGKVKVREIMSKPLVTIDAETVIGKAIEIMSNKRIRRLLVMEGGKIVGIVTQKDLLEGTLNVFRVLNSL